MLENDLDLSFSRHRTALRRQATRKMIALGGDLSTIGVNDLFKKNAEATASVEEDFVVRDNYVTFEFVLIFTFIFVCDNILLCTDHFSVTTGLI